MHGPSALTGPVVSPQKLKRQSTKYRSDNTYPTATSEKPENAKKNRYKDILPCRLGRKTCCPEPFLLASFPLLSCQCTCTHMHTCDCYTYLNSRSMHTPIDAPLILGHVISYVRSAGPGTHVHTCGHMRTHYLATVLWRPGLFT